MKRLLFLFFLSFTLKPHAQELFFSKPTDFQNLPSSEKYAMLQDRKGFLWITTDAGICCYDGNTLKVYTVKDGIPENVVFKIVEDYKGRIWFSSLSGYLFYYENKSFHSIDANEQLKKVCHSIPITSFFIGENDTLHGTLNGGSTGGIRGLLKIPPQHDFRDILIDTTSYKSCSRYLKINKSRPHEFIIGIGKYLSETRTYYLLSYNNHLIKRYFNETEWFGGNSNKAELDRYGTVYIPTGRQLDIITKDGALKGFYLFDERINSCYVDHKDDLWVCTSKGGYLFRNADVGKTPLRFLKDISLSAALLDREETLWVATLEKGVLHCKNTSVLFFNEEKDMPVYLQKDSNQLNITYHSKKIISVFKNDSVYVENSLLKDKDPGSRVFSAYMDKELLCLGGVTALSIFSRKEKTLLLYQEGISVKEVLCAGKDSLFFISPPRLLTYFNKKVRLIKPPFPIRTIEQLSNKKIILSSRNNNGIYEFKNGEFVPYLSEVLPLKTRINAMLEDEKGNTWFATNEYGLYCYDSKKQLHRYTMANGLASDKINSLAIDSNKDLWIGSYNGLSKLSYRNGLQTTLISNFNKSHGIPNVQIEKLIAFNGKIACISKDVCFYFEQEKMKKNLIAPLNYIESVSINDISYDIKGVPVLKYDQNNLRVQASLISYKNTEQRTFLYKLVGYDQNWHASSTGEIGYTNLPHGSYVLTIYGLNNDNIKSTRPTTFTFTITPPFWLTWWFIGLEIILFCILFFFVFMFWKNRIQKRTHAKALINQKIAEFKMTALRSQMNPHFIFNAIGSIQHYILKNEIKQSYNYLSKFSMLIRNILNNSREEYISLSQEINTLRLYIELEQIRFTIPFNLLLK